MKEKIERALFEARPYIEYYEELKRKVEEIGSKVQDEASFIQLVEEEIKSSREPFKTDLKIFLQKFSSL
ncbi:MAG: hypothetical protein PWP49_1828 [Thermococcaceae archaeon]|uniref:hypothetical protein n=1 Tax=Thermococcus TaxID=2263 RepID=UPI0005B2CF4A|nr:MULTISPECIES: hypothetical protein [Thermococcus]MDK2783350.1 hypothetical protein [Thermococcaceae archaeon]MCA6214525.1 hypothetical protein [Thermococcus bergensis]MDK2853758.1 hypothetical protein [Thermococcaceae archaeon]MDN5321408.1 hypothetical protein [Thermococcaceae archaeon]MPW39520.1 hypothetical protein [Thermococcus sp. 101 C5]